MISAMNTSMDVATMAPPVAALAAGVVSAALYGRKRQWINALLVLVAAVGLAVAVSDVRLPQAKGGTLALATDAAGGISAADLLAIPRAESIALTGDGLRDAEWRDLPARPLQWKPADADLLWLDFPRSISLGRMFTLTVRRSQAQAGWRLQLLAENKQVLADSGAAIGNQGAAGAKAGEGAGAVADASSVSSAGQAAGTPTAQLSVQWLPPVAEAMVLQARLLDAGGKVIAQGPIPLQVKDALPLQIQGRFDAPSFDARALNQLLSDGSAILDWSVTLGKAITRSETATAPLTAPNAVFADAAYVEHLNPSARAALLAQAGQGVPLVVLGGNASDAVFWQRELGLRLQPQSPTTEKEDMRQFSVGGAALSMPPATLNPNGAGGEPWSALAFDGKRQPWLWQRGLQKGRVIWIGVSDWHRYAISAPQALTLWWQGAMDKIALASVQKTGWRTPDPMPLPGLRSELCAEGLKPGTALQVDGMAQARLPLQARADKADAACAAIWPQQAGWLKFIAAGIAEPGIEYIYAPSDWPAWQKALRRDATAIYAARGTVAANATANANKTGLDAIGRPLPALPFALIFALGLLALWYRENRRP